MQLTHEQRLEFLKLYNDLRNTLDNIYQCQDMWMSDVGKLQDLKCAMHTVMKFVPQEDDEGRPMEYADWVLVEEDDD